MNHDIMKPMADFHAGKFLSRVEVNRDMARERSSSVKDNNQ